MKKREVKRFDINLEAPSVVDKDVLMRALEYDRDQFEERYRKGYQEGYQEGYNDAIEKVKQVMERWMRGDES